MIELLEEIFNPRSMFVEGIYNLTFEIIATFITYKLLFKPMMIKIVRKELDNGNDDKDNPRTDKGPR